MLDRTREDAGASPPAGRRGLAAILVAAALAFAAVALLHPDAAFACALAFAALAPVILVSGRVRRPVPEIDAPPPAPEAPGPAAPALGAALDALREPAFLVDGELVLRHANPASVSAFGAVTMGEAVALRFRLPEFLAALERAVAGGEPAEAVFSERRPFERIWMVEITPVRLPADAGRSAVFLLLFRDRTEERRLERMRSDFVANASHELRTPLSSLIGFIETLQGPAHDDPAARDRFLTIMRDQGARMSRLIDDLLSLSRIEMKRHLALSEIVDLREILEAVQAEMAFVAEEHGVEIRLEAPEETFPVVGDEDELVQVFSNLVENACKYASSGERVDLLLSRGTEAGRPVIDAAVRDHGPGIAPEHVPRLTERFYRVDVASSRSKQGTGLGLSIVRNILLRHRAQLAITSRIGEGSTFRARFPAAPAQR